MLYNSGAEIALLSCVLNAPQEVQQEIVDCVRPEHFSDGRRKLWSVICALVGKKIAVNAITVTDHAEQYGELEAIGGASTVADIATYSSTYGLWKNHLTLLEDMRYRREGSEFSAWAIEQFKDTTLDICEIKEAVESRLMKLDFSADETDTHSTKTAIIEAIASIERLYNGEDERGLKTGLGPLDRLIARGLVKDEYSIIGARPSTGKTALAMQIAEYVAIYQHKRVAFFSAEMSKAQLMRRQLYAMARIPEEKVRDRQLSRQELAKFSVAATELSKASIIVDDASSPTIGYIRQKARRYHRDAPLDLIVIDYLQLCKGTSKRGREDRRLEVAEISAGIKEIAKTLHCHVLALAQLNRNPDGRKSGKPKVSDLREAGDIEQDADVVMLLSRAESDEEKPEGSDRSGDVIVEVGKHRNGPTGDCTLYFNAPCTRFEEIDWHSRKN
jgi:replicative DNA helicase